MSLLIKSSAQSHSDYAKTKTFCTLSVNLGFYSLCYIERMMLANVLCIQFRFRKCGNNDKSFTHRYKLHVLKAEVKLKDEATVRNTVIIVPNMAKCHIQEA